MTKKALKLALEAFGEIDWSNNSQWQSDRAKVAIATLKEALAQPEHGWTPERIAGMARLKEAQDKKLAQPEQEPVVCDCDSPSWCKQYKKCNRKMLGFMPYVAQPQRTWGGLTPACPQGLTEYACEVEGVDLVCFLEYTPDEEGSRDSRGLLDEPGTYENLELVNAYVKGTDVDIGHLLLQYLVDHITTTALEDFKDDSYE